MSRIDAWESRSLVDFAFNDAKSHEECVKLTERHQRVHWAAAEAGGAKKFLLARLGKQDYCWTGSERNWVWERAHAPKWRAFASTRGLSLEFEHDLTFDQFLESYNDFCERVGVK
jgi:hypothetical protein